MNYHHSVENQRAARYFTNVHRALQRAPENLPEIARQLRVTNSARGSVQKAGDRVHIKRAADPGNDDAHLWAQSYDRQLTDIFG